MNSCLAPFSLICCRTACMQAQAMCMFGITCRAALSVGKVTRMGNVVAMHFISHATDLHATSPCNTPATIRIAISWIDGSAMAAACFCLARSDGHLSGKHHMVLGSY